MNKILLEWLLVDPPSPPHENARDRTQITKFKKENKCMPKAGQNKAGNFIVEQVPSLCFSQ